MRSNWSLVFLTIFEYRLGLGWVYRTRGIICKYTKRSKPDFVVIFNSRWSRIFRFHFFMNKKLVLIKIYQF